VKLYCVCIEACVECSFIVNVVRSVYSVAVLCM